MPTCIAVDDDPAILAILREIAEGLGCRFEEYKRVKEARERLSGYCPDLLLMDGLLPDGKGIDLLHAVKLRHEELPPTVFLSALFKDFNSYKELKSLGVSKVLHKPIPIEMLQLEIAAVLGIKMVQDAGLEPDGNGEMPRDPAVDAFQSEMDKLRAEYLLGLGAVAESLQKLMLKADAGDLQSKEGLADQLHRLAGSAGTYGEQEISSRARYLETALNQGLSPAQVGVQIGRLVALLERVGARSLSTITETKGPRSIEWSPIVITGDPLQAEALMNELVLAGMQPLVPGSLAAACQALQEGDATTAVYITSPGNHPANDDLRKLRKSAGPEVPIIFVGAHNGLRGRIEALSAGASKCLSAPPSAAVLKTMLRDTEAPGYVGDSILLLDDDSSVTAAARTILEERGIGVRAAEDPETFWSLLQDQRPPLIILDWALHVFSGLEVCRVLKSDPRYADIPVVFLSGRMSSRERAAAFHAGAEDHIGKPLVAEDFLARIMARLELGRRHQERCRTDSLTGLANRGAIEEALRRAAERCRRGLEVHRNGGRAPTEGQMGVVIFDIDNFKVLNDTAGHLTGDRALEIVARAFRHCLRTCDQIGRWGGEEFVAIIEDAQPAGFMHLFRRIQSYLAEHPVVDSKGCEYHITLSAGASVLDPPQPFEQALQRADEALYRAKATGKNRVEMKLRDEPKRPAQGRNSLKDAAMPTSALCSGDMAAP